MDERIEDEIFLDALEVQKIRRAKSMYELAEYPHRCSMCQTEEDIKIKDLQKGYKLKFPYVSDFNVPYLYICKECYEELPERLEEN